MVQANCKHCSKEFQYKPTARHPVQHFCSVRCANLSRVVETAEQRFWKHVNKTDHCWLWTGGTVGGGYGIFWLNHPKRMQVAHRFSWEILHGPVPSGLLLCHDCRPLRDNPACVNPRHLFVGTCKDNTQDASQKGTLCKGEENHFSKLTEGQVIQIRSLFDRGESNVSLAAKFGITKDGILKITSGTNWKHLLGRSDTV